MDSRLIIRVRHRTLVGSSLLLRLPPSLCMKYEYVFSCLIIPGPDHPRICLNMMLKPLIEELKHLLEGVRAYDYDQKQKFNLSVVYMWSVHKFRVYNILLGWRCNGIVTCLICLKNTTCFCLKFGRKISYFDYHRCFVPPDHPFKLDRNAFKKDNIVLVLRSLLTFLRHYHLG
jgi:hypothetical protein